MERLGFARLVASERSRERDLVVGMVAARLINPTSKLATTRWWSTTSLPTELAIADATEKDLYAALDWLEGRQEHIEKYPMHRDRHRPMPAMAYAPHHGESIRVDRARSVIGGEWSDGKGVLRRA